MTKVSSQRTRSKTAAVFFAFLAVCPSLPGTAQAGSGGPGPSLVSTDGYRLVVRKRNPDGTLGPPQPYVMRGVVWTPAGPDTATTPQDPNNANVRRLEYGAWYQTDIPLLAAMNVNTVRLLIDPGFDPTLGPVGLSVLDELYANGIMAVMTVDDAIRDLDRIRGAVPYYRDHPAVLAWSLGSEWNLNNYFGGPRPTQCPGPGGGPSQPDCPELLAGDTEEAAALIKTLDLNHPVVSSYGEIDIDAPYRRLADTSRYVNQTAPTVDLWSINVYRGSSFGSLFRQWASISGKPMFVGEFGTDAFRSCGFVNPPPGFSFEAIQASWDLALWHEILRRLSAVDPSQVAVGGTVFSWNDEWWKVSPSDSQQTSGFIFPGAHPDDFANEEYFGIVDIARRPRLVYGTLRDAFSPGYAPDPGFTAPQALIDFSALPDRIETNIAAFLVSGRANPGSLVTLNGDALTLDSAGNFVSRYPIDPMVDLSLGDNLLQLTIDDGLGPPNIIEKTVHFDPALSTAGRQLLYVDSVAPSLNGTAVVDLQANVYLGLLDGLHVRGASPDGDRVYFSNRAVYSSASHAELAPPASPLAFSLDIPSNGFVVSPDGLRLYSRDQILNLANNTAFTPAGWPNIVTGSSFMGAAIPGGPAITPDSRTIFCCTVSGTDPMGNSADVLKELDTAAFTATNRFLSPSRPFRSDLTVSAAGDLLARSEYGLGVGQLFEFHSLPSLAKLGGFNVGLDFTGEVVFLRDSAKAVAGAAGNPQNRGGGLSLIDVSANRVDHSVAIDLADNLTGSLRDEIFVSSGNRLGVDAFEIDACPNLFRTRSYFLGINRFVVATGIPINDDIRVLVLKDVAFLDVSKTGAGSGLVVSDPAGVDCGGDCREGYDLGETVELAASPDFGSLFGGWSGDPDCVDGSLTMDGDRACSARFDLRTFNLSVQLSGGGLGRIVSDPPGIDCGGDCQQGYPFGTQVLLTPEPEIGSEFGGFGGDPDCADGQVTVDSDLTCTARFDVRILTLAIDKTGNGSGTVTSDPPGIDCGADCQQTYPYGTLVTLTSASGVGSRFVGWGGDPDCLDGVVTIDADKTCVADFSLQVFRLTVAKSGDGSGRVTSQPAGIDCGADCQEDYPYGTQVTLQAAPDFGSRFDGFGGHPDCADGSLTIDGDRSCSAAFTLSCHLLTLAHTGSGGDPTATPSSSAGCGAGRYHAGQAIQLGAPPAPEGFTIGSWSGTANDSSRSQQNALTMPDGDHVVTVHYIAGFDPPVAIRLVSFEAFREPPGVRLQWRTGEETGNLGFHLYRQDATETRRLTSGLIAGSALISAGTLREGFSYSWFDTSGDPGPDTVYWLEDWDLDGTRTRHGPIRLGVSPGGESSGKPQSAAAPLNQLGHAVENSAVKARPPLDWPAGSLSGEQSRRETQRRIAASPAVKLTVREEGLYRVSFAELIAAGLAPDFDPANLRLYADGQETPRRVSPGPDGSVVFYGFGEDTPWSEGRVYWLVAEDSPGLPIQPEAPADAFGEPAASFPRTLEWKPRTTYFPALLNGDAENFFGPVVADEAASRVFEAPYYDADSDQTPSLEVSLQGVSGGHRVSVSCNGSELGVIQFQGREAATGLFTLPAGLLRSGANTVELRGQDGGEDISMIDLLRLTYPRRYVAENDRLIFTAPPSGAVVVNGFGGPGIEVLDVTNPAEARALTPIVERSANGYSARFATAGPEPRRLIAARAGAFLRPFAAVVNRPSSWHRERSGAEAVIVSHRGVWEEAARLAEFRREQGRGVLLVDVEDLYDEYGFGSPTPFALREWLQEGGRLWRTRPEFLLLAGDASFDPKNYLGLDRRDSVPTRIVETPLSETALDDWFGDLDGDGDPDLAIGRLPVQDREEARIVVEKIIAYEARPEPGPWRNSVALVSDFRDDFPFERESHRLSGMIPSGRSVVEISRGMDDSARRLEQALIRGQSLVGYLGHGSIQRWAGGLMTASRALELGNRGRLPFVVSMACLTGQFHGPQQSLGEAWLLAPRGGAVAALASPSLDGARDQTAFNEAIFRLLFAHSDRTLGEVVRLAKLLPGVPGSVRNYVLLGDPMTRLVKAPPASRTGWRAPH